MSLLKWLENWYSDKCNCEWEHHCGIIIETFDGPGWSVKIDLKGTPLEAKIFGEVEFVRSENDWMDCKVEDGVFQGHGGPANLEEILYVFYRWASQCEEN